jgi:hypothetical protein
MTTPGMPGKRRRTLALQKEVLRVALDPSTPSREKLDAASRYAVLQSLLDAMPHKRPYPRHRVEGSTEAAPALPETRLAPVEPRSDG